MRDYARNHAIKLEDSGDVDEVRGKIGRGGNGGRARPGPYSRYLDLVCPCNEECGIILPM